MAKVAKGFSKLKGATIIQVDATAINEVFLRDDAGNYYIIEAGISSLSLRKYKVVEVEHPQEALKRTRLRIAQATAQERATVMEILGGVESVLPGSCRYKSYEAIADTKTIHWVTQESGTYESKLAAAEIVKVLKANGLKGWIVKVVVRDDYCGDDTKWHCKLKS